jgi:hypothetical protein
VLKRVHVNMHAIRRNRMHATNEPPISVKTSRGNIRGYGVRIEGPSEVIYRPERPLACGARVWIETTASVLVSDGDTTIELP